MFFILIFILVAYGCNNTYYKVIDSLPDYTDSEIYGGVEFREGMTYSKYYYKEEDLSSIQNNKYLDKVTDENIDEIEGYFRNYTMLLRDSDVSDIKKNYDFIYGTDIQVGDYYYVYTIEGKKVDGRTYGKYDSYYLYYFDVDRLILYYIQSTGF